MKYLIEAEKILKDLFYGNWMDEEDWKSFLIELEMKTGVTLSSLSNNIENGVDNGYSLENQITIIKRSFK